MFFSVIVPIYKVENYLERCIDSILCQSFGDFELILVDDGSPDKCPQICDDYAKRDKRIKVVHKENGGLVSARQAGTKVAEGEYIFNVDSDDAITPDALKKAYDIIKNTDADIVSFLRKFYENDAVGDRMDDIIEEGLYVKADFEEKIFPHVLCNKNMKHTLYFITGRAVRRSLIMQPQLNINTEISLGEDLCCGLPCMFAAEKMYFSNDSVYLYTIRSDSLSKDFNTKQFELIEKVIKYLKNLGCETAKDFDEQISRYCVYMCFAILAAAAQGNYFKYTGIIKKKMLTPIIKEELKKASFDGVTAKSRIGIALMKKGKIKSAFYFLWVCKIFKQLLRR